MRDETGLRAGEGIKAEILDNTRMEPKELKEFCALDEATQELLKTAMAGWNLSARAYDRILKVAQGELATPGPG